MAESHSVDRPVQDDVASILSSRMTDIASDDGGEYAAGPSAGQAAQQSGRRPSVQTGTVDESERPTTGVTGVSSQRGAWSQANAQRRGFLPGNSTQRGSTVSSTTIPRPKSSASKTHVPSIQSHAFFRPMTSQRLQAQRGGGSRPLTLAQQPHDGIGEDGQEEANGNVARNSVNSLQTARQGLEDGDGRPPPSRGTEMTEQDTVGRITATTSPTQGHHPNRSLTESVRPLQRNTPNTKGLMVNTDKSYKNGGGLATPSKSPHSFRSSFLLPSRNEVSPNSPNRSTHGREKLSSVASSPGLTPMDAPKEMVSQKKKNLGGNFEYFTGNTVFFFGGRFQNTQDKPINIATGLLVLVPGILFFIFSAPWLWHNTSPAIPILFAYVYYICLSSFIHASVSDPGVSTICHFMNIHTNACRSFLEIFTQCLRLMKMMIRYGWLPLRTTGQ